MSFADKIGLEMDGMKSPESDDMEESTEPKEEKDMESSAGAMALEAIKKNDGEAFAEAIRSIMSEMPG